MNRILSKISIVCLFSLVSMYVHAQGFIWAKGSNTINASGLYGTMGVVNAGNNPGARYGACSWKDAAGNFWLFGGNGYDALGNQGRLNDLWKYDVVNNNWTWINGASVIAQVGVYGLLGVPSSTIKPGSRSNAMTWVDNSGNVYLFGGFGYDAFANLGNLGDLWKYNPSTNQWTWLKGSNACFQAGVYGTQGSANATNVPGARNAATTWKDNTGNFWMFGGLGITTNTNTTVNLNDLWKYDIGANQWTWIGGSNLGNQNGSYGTLGSASSTTTPGGRYGAVSWVDASGNLLLFGGNGYDATATSANFLNDLWKYDLGLNQWVWLKGSNGNNQNGVYGTQGAAAAGNIPGSRSNAMTWQDSYGNYWLSGGTGYSALNQGSLNDMWTYNASSNNWTWVAGAGNGNLPGVYGNMNFPGPTNIFGARHSCANWLDANNNLFVFGGLGLAVNSTQGSLADTWKYTNCVINPITMTITSNVALPCAKETLSLTVVGSNSYTWQTVPTSTLSYLVISPTITTTYSVITNNTNACIYMATFTQSVSACTALNEINASDALMVYPNPSKGAITVNINNANATRLKVYTMTGQLVFEQELLSGKNDLILNLEKGIYYYHCVQQEKTSQSGKLLIN